MAELGLSVITVNRVFSTDFSRTFYELDKLGIRNLEFKTFFGYDAKTLKKSMDFYGMKSLAIHERKRDLRDLELLKRMIEYHQILNTKYIVYTLGAVNIQSEIDALIDDLNNAGRILKKTGWSFYTTIMPVNMRRCLMANTRWIMFWNELIRSMRILNLMFFI